MATIAVLGTFDTQGEEHAFIAKFIRERGNGSLLINVGSGAPPSIKPGITREQTAPIGDLDLPALLSRIDRGECIKAMSKADPILLAAPAAEGKIHELIEKNPNIQYYSL